MNDEGCFFINFQSVGATVNLRYVTQGRLKKSGTSFNPELGQIKLSLTVDDPAWIPRQGLDKWDSDSKTFTEVSSINSLHFYAQIVKFHI